MNETEWYNAIWDMLASGNSAEEIKSSASMIDFDSLVDEVEKDYIKEEEL